MLQETRSARQSIAAKDTAAALQHVHQALADANAARDQAVADGKPLNVPVDTSIDETVLYAPVKHNDSMKRDTNVRQVTGTYTRDYIDVGLASNELNAAETALNNGNLQAADASLAAVQAAVTHQTSVQTDMPLLRVREDLRLARYRVLDGKYKDAEAPLTSAGQALAEYARINPGPHADEARAMQRDIEAYASNITHDHSDAAARIDGWMDTANTWFHEMTE
jgi:hypothetical protein